MSRPVKITLEQASSLYKEKKELRETLLNSFTVDELDFDGSLKDKEHLEIRKELIELMNTHNKGWKPVFNGEKSFIGITFTRGKIHYVPVRKEKECFLVFKENKDVISFLSKNSDLINKYYKD